MCTHSELKEGYCISCGIQQDIQYNYINSYDNNYNNINHNNNKHINLLNKILHSMNISNYKSDILLEYNNKKFISRLSIKDKLLLCIYKYLRSIDYPIVFSDIERYSSRIKSKWFREYKYIPVTNNYIINLVGRYNNNNNIYSNDSSNNITHILKMVDKYKNHPIEKIIKEYVCNK